MGGMPIAEWEETDCSDHREGEDMGHKGAVAIGEYYRVQKREKSMRLEAPPP